MMRALLLWNPQAAGMSPRVLDVIAHALRSELKLDVVETEAREHATDIAARAVSEGYEAIVCLGGDGTLNEVINGIGSSGITVIPFPGGGTNVFARTLGLPKDPIEATSVVIEKLQRGEQPRSVTLGEINGRRFSFCSGVGVDAAIVRAVERRPRLKRRLGQAFFVTQGLVTWAFGFPHSGKPLSVEIDGERIEDLRTLIACNSSPYTYLGKRPFHIAPGADMQHGLTMFASRSLGPLKVTRVILTSFGRQRQERFRGIEVRRDVTSMRVVSSEPMPWHADGEYGGEDTEFVFRSIAGGMHVLR